MLMFKATCAIDSENTVLHVTYIWHCNEGAHCNEGTVATELRSNGGGIIEYVITSTVIAVAILTTAATAYSL